MEILPFLGMALITVVLLSILRRDSPEMAVMLSIVAGVMIFLRLVGRLTELVEAFNYLALRAKIDYLPLQTVLRVMGVAYLAGFGAQICKDAGESSLGLKLELAGKIVILFLAVPVMVAIMEMILRLL
ncbi:MAG TPA: stage III sporulation protein AD [Bacillota bacterium]